MVAIVLTFCLLSLTINAQGSPPRQFAGVGAAAAGEHVAAVR